MHVFYTYIYLKYVLKENCDDTLSKTLTFAYRESSLLMLFFNSHKNHAVNIKYSTIYRNNRNFVYF